MPCKTLLLLIKLFSCKINGGRDVPPQQQTEQLHSSNTIVLGVFVRLGLIPPIKGGSFSKEDGGGE
jgi:hypothetical protein